MVKSTSKKKRLTPGAVFSSLLLMFTTAFCVGSQTPALAQAAAQSGNQGGQTSDTNVQAVGSTQKSYLDRNPEAAAYMQLKGDGKTDNEPTTISNEKYPYDWKTPPGAWTSDSPSKSSKYDTDTYTTTGGPSTDTSDAIHTNHALSRGLEKLFVPERMMHAATGVAGVAANNAANSEAGMAVNQAFSAIDYSKQFLANFTAEPGNVWQAIRDQLFIPMAVLLLLPGAVLAQVRAIVAQGSPVLIGQEVHPFEGILRSIVAIFLIPATFLVINYGIDVANSITFTIADEYRRLFGSDMYEDAKCAIQRAYPTNKPQDNRNAIDQASRPRASGGLTVFATLERNTIGLALIDPCLGIYESIMPDETVPQAVNIMRSVLNGMGASAAMSWNVACAFQMAFLYYLWCMGPIAAALWVWPIAKMRAALGTWVEGVVTICFWSLFWNTVILLIACFKGVGFTGTIIVSALLSLAILSIKSAFDFSGLAASAADMAMQQALKAASQASKGGGGGGSGGGQSGGGAANKGGQSPGASTGDKHQPSQDKTASTPTAPSTPSATPSTTGDTTSSTRSPGTDAAPGSTEGKPKTDADTTGAPPGAATTPGDASKSDANKGPEVAPPPNANAGADADKANAANKGDADKAKDSKDAGKDGGLPPGAGAGLGAGSGSGSGPANTSGVAVTGNAHVNQTHDAKSSSEDSTKNPPREQPLYDTMGNYTGHSAPLGDASGTRGVGAVPGGPGGPGGTVDANGRPIGPDGAAVPGGPNDPNNPQRVAGDATASQNATGIPNVAPDAARFEAAAGNLAKEGIGIASDPKFAGVPGSSEAKALGTVAAGENANLYKAAVNDPTGINPSGVSNADAFQHATGVSAGRVTEAAQGNPEAGREVHAALANQSHDRSAIGGSDTARSIPGTSPNEPGRTSSPDTSAPQTSPQTVANNTGATPQPAPASDVFRSGTADVTTSSTAPHPGPGSVTSPGSQPAATTPGDNSPATIHPGSPQPAPQTSGDSFRQGPSNDVSAPINQGSPQPAPQTSGDSFRQGPSNDVSAPINHGSPQVASQPSGDSVRQGPSNDVSAPINHGSPQVASQPSGDSFRQGPGNDVSAPINHGSPQPAPQTSGDTFRQGPSNDVSAPINHGSPQPAPQTSGDAFRQGPSNDVSAPINHGSPVPSSQPTVNNDSTRVNNYDTSASTTVHQTPAPAPSPAPGPQQTVSQDPGVAPSQPSYAPQSQPQSAPQPQPGSGDVMRSASYDTSVPSASSQPVSGHPTSQPSQPQVSSETTRSSGYETSAPAPAPQTVHNPGQPQPSVQPGSSDQTRVAGDNTYSPQYNSTQQPVAPPSGPGPAAPPQVSSSETHMRTSENSSGIISPASGGTTPVNYSTSSTPPAQSTPHVPNSGGEVRYDSATQSPGQTWSNTQGNGQTWTTSNEPQRPAQTWNDAPVNREAPPAPNHVVNNNLERPSAPEQRAPERAEYRAEPGSSAYVPPIIGQSPQAPPAHPANYSDSSRINETHAQQQRVEQQQRNVEHQQQQQRAAEQRADAPRPQGNQSRPPASAPPQVFVQPQQQPPARPESNKAPQQPASPQQAKQASAAPPPEAPQSKDAPLTPNSGARSGGPTQKSIGDVLRKMGQAPGEKKKRKPGDPPEQQ